MYAKLEAYDRLETRQSAIPAPENFRVNQARNWIAQLYRDWGKREKAAEWSKQSNHR